MSDSDRISALENLLLRVQKNAKLRPPPGPSVLAALIQAKAPSGEKNEPFRAELSKANTAESPPPPLSLDLPPPSEFEATQRVSPDQIIFEEPMEEGIPVSA